MKAKISMLVNPSLSELSIWSNSIWKETKQKRMEGHIGYIAKLIDVDITINDNNDLLIDHKYYKNLNMYVNRIDNEFIDEEFDEIGLLILLKMRNIK